MYTPPFHLLVGIRISVTDSKKVGDESANNWFSCYSDIGVWMIIFFTSWQCSSFVMGNVCSGSPYTFKRIYFTIWQCSSFVIGNVPPPPLELGNLKIIITLNTNTKEIVILKTLYGLM